MQNLRNPPILLRVTFILLVVPLLGLGPQAHAAISKLVLARQTEQAGSLATAAALVNQAAQLLPRRADLWARAGQWALQGGEASTALVYLQQASQMGTLDFTSQLGLGDAYQQVGDPASAILAWQVLLPAGGSSSASSMALSAEALSAVYQRVWTAELQLKDYPAAIQALQALVNLGPADAQLVWQLGNLLATQQPDAATAYLTQAAEQDPSLSIRAETYRRNLNTARLADDPAYSLLAAGRMLATWNEWDLAAEAFRQASLRRPDYAETWAYLGEARQHQAPSGENSHVDQAYQDLQKALELDPQSLAANTLMALYWQRQGKFDQALSVLQTVLRDHPDNPALQVQAGRLQALMGDLETALSSYQKAVSLAPQDPSFLSYLADFSLTYTYKIQEIALPAARQAVILAPDQPIALDTMGYALIKLNDLTNAERFLERALQIDPDYAPAHLHLGQIYLLRGENGPARQELEQTRNLDASGIYAEMSQRLLKTYFP